jgi:hypothetical protein
MYYSYVEIEYVATSFSPARTDLALKLLTEDTLRQICGVNTTFQQISCGYGILPPKFCKALQANQNIQDWGTAAYYKQGSSIREYFY